MTEYKRKKKMYFSRFFHVSKKSKLSPEKKIPWFQTLKKYLQKTAVENLQFHT